MHEMRQYRVLYFASLRDRSGRGEELHLSAATTPAQLYDELKALYDFNLDREHLRVAINDAFAEWERPLTGGETIVFIPPVAGG